MPGWAKAGGSRTRPYASRRRESGLFFCGGICGATSVAYVDGFDFEAVLIHIKALLAVEGFDEFAGGAGDGAGKVGGIDLRGGSLCFILAVLIAKRNFKSFHVVPVKWIGPG